MRVVFSHFCRVNFGYFNVCPAETREQALDLRNQTAVPADKFDAQLVRRSLVIRIKVMNVPFRSLRLNCTQSACQLRGLGDQSRFAPVPWTPGLITC